MNAREVALCVVRDVFVAPGSAQRERGAQESLDYRARKAELSARDRAFATELAYGAIKMRRALDWHLEGFIGGRAQPLPPAIREILRLAAYELAYTRADAHATVFEWVNLAKHYGHRGLANLVNAVLRGLLRHPPQTPGPESSPDPREYLGARYSLPTWLVRQWEAAFGERVEAICAAVNEPARTAISVDVGKRARDEVALDLLAAGVRTRPSAYVCDSLIVEEGEPALFALERTAGGAWWVQSESSAMAVAALNPQPGERIADVCSGRGNKALQIAGRLLGEGSLLCLDRDARKIKTLQARLASAGAPAALVVGDAAAGALPQDERFDRILLDAPCSGTGVVGRHPEARWKKQGSDGERLALTQRALLERTARHVLAGGALVYAVCSTDPRETMEVVDWFVLRDNFTRGLMPAAFEPFLTQAGDVLVPPGIDGRDGFYIARLERRP